jgi:hypothetical protein
VLIEVTVDLIFMLTVTYNLKYKSNRSGVSFVQIETDTEGVKLI